MAVQKRTEIANLKGPQGATGPRGFPAPEAVPTDEFMGVTIGAGAETAAGRAVQEIAIPVHKRVSEGIVPAPLRAPVLGVEQQFPNERSPYVPVWFDSATTFYGYGQDSTLRKTTDGGKTWTKLGYNAWGFGSYGSFLKLASGTLLNISSASPPRIQRSTNDGATWADVYSFRANTVPLGAQSWCIDPTSGTIWLGEYNVSPTAEILLLKSIDDGTTFSTVHSFPGEATAVGTSGRIRHIHSVQWDHIMGRCIISTGDSTPDTGLYRTNANGTGVEPILLNSMRPAEEIDSPRSIGVIPFPEYLVWAGDTTQNPYVYRMARSEIGKPAPVVEKIYRLNSAAWFTCRASDDGSRWIISASEEGASIDNMVHLYAIEDQGSTVFEVAAIPAPLTSPAGAFQPVGVPEQGERFRMVTRGFGDSLVYQFRVGNGLVPLPKPNPLTVVRERFTVSSGVLTLAPSEERLIGVHRAGGLAPRLYLFETSLDVIDLAGGTAGSQTVRIRKRGQAHVHTGTDTSERYTSRQELGGAIASYLFTGGDIIEFYVRNNSTTATTKVISSVTFGWGTA